MAAAFAEIAGCFAFWVWLRQGKSIWWVAPGIISLAAFAFLLTLVPAAGAGRAYAAYGGVCIAASLVWLWAVEKMPPDRWDIIGAAVCLLGAGFIIFGPSAAMHWLAISAMTCAPPDSYPPHDRPGRAFPDRGQSLCATAYESCAPPPEGTLSYRG